MKKILVTGGCGYIGSHAIIELVNGGQYDAISVDNYLNSFPGTMERIKTITGKEVQNYAVDLCDLEATRQIFVENPDIVGIIHFAALKSVGESMEFPLSYYHNNIQSQVNILKCCKEFGVEVMVFSSSCSVYGDAETLPVSEATPLAPISPYGRTKYMGEKIIEDFVASEPNGTQIMGLRYFNPVGAHISGKNGEVPTQRPNNLIPYITQVAAGIKEQLTVFGGDYNTRDGSCIRDYIHVTDIAIAHIQALDYIFEGRNSERAEFLNLGTGNGVTVFEAIQAFERVSGEKLNYIVGPRRIGDVETIYADNTKARELLGWNPTHTIDDMMESAWKWQQELTPILERLHSKK